MWEDVDRSRALAGIERLVRETSLAGSLASDCLRGLATARLPRDTHPPRPCIRCDESCSGSCLGAQGYSIMRRRGAEDPYLVRRCDHDAARPGADLGVREPSEKVVRHAPLLRIRKANE